jgi:enamine deaminase RidA (YjgF/YER057c/UK114 family)
MQARIFRAFGRRFVHLGGEAIADLSPDAALRELLERYGRELALVGLSLDDTVRSRLWAPSAADRLAASNERRKVLSEKARGASSSYISTSHFHSRASVALDLLAMEPVVPGTEKVIIEYEPPIAPPVYVAYDGMVFLSGVCPDEPDLEGAVGKALAEIGADLKRAGTDWEHVVRIGCYVTRKHTLAAMDALLSAAIPIANLRADYVSVDGHAKANSHVEIEVTARAPGQGT